MIGSASIMQTMSKNEETLVRFLVSGMHGRLWQDGPCGEIWVDDTVDVVGEFRVFQHEPGERERYRGVTPS